jgi:glycosyltransferase involved in cell wall biosynthesis
MKVAIWANSPSPHQADFYEALRCAGVDLCVMYLGHLRAARLAMGWSEPERMAAGENIVASPNDLTCDVPDWRERLHVVPGYSRREHRALAVMLSKAGVPWVHWSENSQPSWRSVLTYALKRWYGRLVRQHALGAFAIGRHAALDFRRWGVPQEKIAHLYYSIRGHSPREPLPVDRVTSDFVANRTAFVYVGSVNHNKATKILIRAFANAIGDRRDAALVIVGDGPDLSACRRLSDALGMQDRILFRGVVPIAQIRSIYASCHVSVLPSRYDGWGVVLNEAASCGLALIATDCVGGADHLLEPGLNGSLISAGSVRSLEGAMRSYMNDRRLSLLQGAHSRVLFDRFTPEMNVHRFVTSVRGWLAACPQWAAFHAQALAISPELAPARSAA